MNNNVKQNGFNIVAGILWILGAIAHGWFYITGIVNSHDVGSNILVLGVLIFGIITAVLMLIAGIILLTGEVGFLSVSSLIIAIMLTLDGVLFGIAGFASATVFLVAVAFIMCSVAFYVLFSAARKVNRGYDLGSLWFIPMIFYGIGIIFLIIFAFSGIRSVYSSIGCIGAKPRSFRMRSAIWLRPFVAMSWNSTVGKRQG